MDAFELLLRASDPELQLDEDFKEVSASTNGKVPFDYRDHLKNTMLDPIDSIMMLADQASQKSPIRKNFGEGAYSPDPISDHTTNDFGEDTRGIGTLLQYGSYFTSGSPFLPSNNRRSRAMSEPWLRQDNWSEELQFNRTLNADHTSNPGLALVAAAAASANGSAMTNGGSLFSAFSFGEHREGRLGMFNAEHRLGYSTLDSSLPHLLDQYAAIYNKNGRIGIYTREERSAIIHRFREKRKRRVWKKKIRYFCRKNLADRRVRVKGRFVKSMASKGVVPGSTPSSASSTSGSSDSPTTTTTTSTSRAVAGSIAAAAANGRYASRTQVAAAVRARQAHTSPGSEEEDEEEDEEEMDEEEDLNCSGNMEVVFGDMKQQPAATTTTEKKKPRRLKLVLSSGASSSDSASATANPVKHTVSSAQSPEDKLIFSREAIKKESADGCTQQRSTTRTASESDADDQDGEEEDVFDSETAGMLRLPTGKRIRRHSIAY